MDNVEFVKAYEQWKNSEARDTSPERFALQLEFELIIKRMSYLQSMAVENGHVTSEDVRDVATGEYDDKLEGY